MLREGLEGSEERERERERIVSGLMDGYGIDGCMDVWMDGWGCGELDLSPVDVGE